MIESQIAENQILEGEFLSCLSEMFTTNAQAMHRAKEGADDNGFIFETSFFVHKRYCGILMKYGLKPYYVGNGRYIVEPIHD